MIDGVLFETGYLRVPDEFTVADDVVLEARHGDTEIDMTRAEIDGAIGVGEGVFRLKSGSLVRFLSSAVVHDGRLNYPWRWALSWRPMSRRPRKSSACVTLVLIGAAALSGCGDTTTSRRASYASQGRVPRRLGRSQGMRGAGHAAASGARSWGPSAGTWHSYSSGRGSSSSAAAQ